MSEKSQQSRLISIDTPVGKDALILTAMYGHEALSEPFNFQLELLSVKNDIKAEDIVNYTRKPNYLERFAERLGVTMANAVTATITGTQLPLR